jgi:hypothetical protein
LTRAIASDVVSFFVFDLWLRSVWVPSQTISVMTTTGKSALRRKRFTDPLIGRVPAL